MKFPIFVDYFTKSFGQRYELLSDESVGHSVNFSEDFDEKVGIKETLKVSRNGRLNGLLLRSRTNFTKISESLGACISYCQPVIIPLKDVEVSEGSTIHMSLEYEMGGGFDSLAEVVGGIAERVAGVASVWDAVCGVAGGGDFGDCGRASRMAGAAG